MNARNYALETLLFMVLIEMKPSLRFKRVLKLDEKIRDIEVMLMEDQVLKFISDTKSILEEFV